MLLKSVALISVLAVLAQSVPAPVNFREVVAEAAPKVPSNLATYQFGVDFAGAVPSNKLQCLNQAGYAVIFVRVYDPTGQGSFDKNSCNTILNAQRAGLGVEVYMTPQPYSNKQGYQQLDEIYQGLSGCGIATRAIWIQVASSRSWPNNSTPNINFISSIVSRARQHGMAPGIYTNYDEWNKITNGWSTVGSYVSLWYWNVLAAGPNGETPADFNDFRPFGGWTAPAVKQFAQLEQICGNPVNRDVFIGGAMFNSSYAVQEDGKIYAGGFIHGNK